MSISPFLLKHMDAMHDLFAAYGVDKAWVFGSCADKRFDNDSSDVDVMVEMRPLPPIQKGEFLLELWDALEQTLDRKVDLLTANNIKNPYLTNSIDRSKRLIYDREGKKVPV